MDHDRPRSVQSPQPGSQSGPTAPGSPPSGPAAVPPAPGQGGSADDRRSLSSRLRESVASGCRSGVIAGDSDARLVRASEYTGALLPEDVALLPSQAGTRGRAGDVRPRRRKYGVPGSWRDQMEAVRRRHGAERRRHRRDRRRPGTGRARRVVQRVGPAVQGHGRPAATARASSSTAAIDVGHSRRQETAPRWRFRRSPTPRSPTCASRWSPRTSRCSATSRLKLTAGDGSKPVEADEPLHRRRPSWSADATFNEHRHRCAAGDSKGAGPGIKPARRPSTRSASPSRPTRPTLTDVKQTAWATTRGHLQARAA